MSRKRAAAQVLRDAWARLALRGAGPGERLPEPYPETVFLLAGMAPGARKALEVFPQEARAWRTLAEMEAARARVWSGQGRVWDAGVCTGRAQAYRAAAEQVEDVLIESLELWDEYERQTAEGGR
ncbi:hypothetical protein [Spirillospora sp. NPDC048824]|uniref:hypothetical protein n=1 Tax=Spirillospora sp. NPDC048824 TaxID=3364526 RepID=UPI00371BE087